MFPLCELDLRTAGFGGQTLGRTKVEGGAKEGLVAALSGTECIQGDCGLEGLGLGHLLHWSRSSVSDGLAPQVEHLELGVQASKTLGHQMP